MSVKVHIHPFLINITDNKDLHEVEGNTVRECLENLTEKYPDLKEWLFAKDGNLNHMFEIFINMESTGPDGLTRPVVDGDEIHLVIIIAGG